MFRLVLVWRPFFEGFGLIFFISWSIQTALCQAVILDLVWSIQMTLAAIFEGFGSAIDRSRWRCIWLIDITYLVDPNGAVSGGLF
jgi:hypothetical protein